MFHESTQISPNFGPARQNLLCRKQGESQQQRYPLTAIGVSKIHDRARLPSFLSVSYPPPVDVLKKCSCLFMLKVKRFIHRSGNVANCPRSNRHLWLGVWSPQKLRAGKGVRELESVFPICIPLESPRNGRFSGENEPIFSIEPRFV